MNAGELRTPCMIQARADPKDTLGAFEPVWTDVGHDMVKVEPQFGFRKAETEQTTAEMVRAATTYRITMRYRPDITELHRLILLGPPDLLANILTVEDPTGKRAELTLICTTGLSSG